MLSRLIILTLLMGVFSAMAYSQDKYLVNGKILALDYDFRRVKVVLIDGNSAGQLEVSDKGLFSVKLDWNKKYFFKLSKPGYVTKIVEFSTFIPAGRSHSIEPFDMTVSLFPVFEGVDTVFFKKPVAKVYYDDKLSDFTDDRDYALKVVYRIKKMLKKSREIASNSINPRKDKLPRYGKKNEFDRVPTPDLQEAVKSSVSSFIDMASQKNKKEIKSSYELLPLKKFYPQGRTIESFYVDGKEITRVVIRKTDRQDVFFQVRHPWGGVFYFLDETPLGIFSVTKNLFMLYTGLSPAADKKMNVVMNKN